MSDVLDFVDAFVNVAPPWLRRTRGAKLLRAFGDVTATVFHATSDGVAARFPGAVAGAVDALPYIGRDRRILRGPAEDDATYAARLRTWWDAHRRRGGPYAMLEQLYLYLVNTEPRQWDLVYRNGVRFILDGVAGGVTRDKLDDITIAPQWARAVLIALYDDYPEISLAQRDAYTAIPREWSAAHMQPIPTVAVWGGGVWDYPDDGLYWDSAPDEYWDEGALVVDDLFPDGAYTTDGLDQRGGTMTQRSSYVTVAHP